MVLVGELAQPIDQPFNDAVDCSQGYFLFVLEMQVDRPTANCSLRRNVGDSRFFESHSPQELFGCIEDSIAHGFPS